MPVQMRMRRHAVSGRYISNAARWKYGYRARSQPRTICIGKMAHTPTGESATLNCDRSDSSGLYLGRAAAPGGRGHRGRIQPPANEGARDGGSRETHHSAIIISWLVGVARTAGRASRVRGQGTHAVLVLSRASGWRSPAVVHARSILDGRHSCYLGQNRHTLLFAFRPAESDRVPHHGETSTGSA